MKIIVDTREQRPLEFPARIKTVRRRLKYGDYSLVGHSTKGVVVERKSLNDFFGSFTRGREDMARKLKAMGERFARAYLLVEAPIADVLNGSRYSRIDGGYLMARVVELCADADVVPLFAEDRDTAAATLVHLFSSYLAAIRGEQPFGATARKDSAFEARQKRVYARRDTV